MSRNDAHQLLDQAAQGADVTEEQITRALMRTGDITPLTHSELRVASRRPVWAFVEGLEA
jgi:hypothetical protein